MVISKALCGNGNTPAIRLTDKKVLRIAASVCSQAGNNAGSVSGTQHDQIIIGFFSGLKSSGYLDGIKVKSINKQYKWLCEDSAL